MQDVENKTCLHFLWENRKRGGACERPAEAQTAVFWHAFEIKGGDNMACKKKDKGGRK